MSLIAWYPLTGDGVNRGLNNTNLSTMGSIPYSAGKIGNAATFSGSAANCLHRPGFELTDNFTWACWIKITASASTYQFILSEGRDYEKYGMNLITFTNGNIGILYGTNSSLVVLSSPTLNTWYHIAIVVSSTQNIKGYVNGTLTATGTYKVPDYTYSSDRFVVGKMSYSYTNTSNYFPFNGQVNDVRIYDHCLSAKEVKEISKGLVLHYKLTGNSYGNPNLLLGSQAYNLNQTGTTRLSAGNRLDTTLYTLSSAIGKTFTVSYDIDMEGSFSPVSDTPSWDTSGSRSGPYVSVSYNGGSITYYTPHITQKGKGRKFFNFTLPSTWTSIEYIIVNLEINGYPTNGQTWSISNVKLEEGSKATPYIPNYQENIYSNLGFNYSIEYDCSGYCHNGTKVKVVSSNGAPRYNNCEAFLGTTVDNSSNTLTGAAYITAGLPLPASSALTVSWWGKITKYGRGGIFETTSATSDYVNGTDYSTTAFANWDSTFGIYNGSTRINLYSNMGIPNSSWQLNTITFDGTNVKYYKNGTLISTNALSGTLPAFNGIKIGIGKAGGVYRQIQQYVSDFRIYVTALSAADIKELYQIPISIDKSGNAFAMEFIEEIKPEFHKNGIIENSYIHENEADDSDTLNTFHIGKTKTFANQILEV